MFITLTNITKMKTLIISLILLISISAKSQSALVQQEYDRVVGTWIIDGEPTNKWIFTANNICRWEYEGETLNQFTFTITNGFSASGLEHTSLKLISVSDSNQIFQYDINSLGINKMTLESVKPMHGFTFFTKE